MGVVRRFTAAVSDQDLALLPPQALTAATLSSYLTLAGRWI